MQKISLVWCIGQREGRSQEIHLPSSAYPVEGSLVGELEPPCMRLSGPSWPVQHFSPEWEASELRYLLRSKNMTIESY